MSLCGIQAGRGWPALFFFTIGLMAGACSRTTPESTTRRGAQPGLSYAEELQSERRAKDQFFRTGEQSPVPAALRSQFQGLEYFPANTGLRYQARLNRYPQPQSIRIGTNTGEIRSGLRYGYFEFEVEGKPCRLQAYRMDDDAAGTPPYLFIPFRDLTSATETYGAGRYLEMRENTTGVYDLDFNRAFNPYCAYNSTYSCPVPPEENRLSVAIRAGELAYAH
jgi:uncharacterized protein